jgi:hypothetical protein
VGDLVFDRDFKTFVRHGLFPERNIRSLAQASGVYLHCLVLDNPLQVRQAPAGVSFRARTFEPDDSYLALEVIFWQGGERPSKLRPERRYLKYQAQ